MRIPYYLAQYSQNPPRPGGQHKHSILPAVIVAGLLLLYLGGLLLVLTGGLA